MKISCSVDIKCSPGVAFGWLEKPEKAMAWMTSVSETEILHQTTGIVGTTFREIVQEDGNTMEMRGVISGFEPGRSIRFHLDSRVNTLDVQYSVAEIPGGVRVSECANVNWKFPVKLYSLFFAEKMRQGIVSQLRAEFARLKDLCEGESLDPRGN